MLIDAHHHLWRYNPVVDDWIDPASVLARDFLAADFDTLATEHGVDASVLVQAGQNEEHTAWLCEQARASDRIAAVVGWLDLRRVDIGERLEHWRATPELVGLRHIVQGEPDPDFLLGDDFVRGVDAALQAGLSYDILVYAHQSPKVADFVARLSPGRLILDHGAKPDIAHDGWQPWADAITAIARHPNVWCKLSGLVTEADHAAWTPEQIERYMRHLLDSFGPERLIFGSDWPVCLLAASYAQVQDLAVDFVARHCPDHHDAVFGGNAIKAYDLKL